MDISPGLSEVLIKALTVGVETSVSQLAYLISPEEESRLEATLRTVSFVEHFKLELRPPLENGEFDTLRVLRLAKPATDPKSHVLQLMTTGEGPTLEFKSSMFTSMRDWNSPNKIVELPSLPGELLKTVCAFLNADGGDLLVGVDDSGKPCRGLSLDLELKSWNVDKWQLHFHSLISSRFHDGPQISPFIQTSMLYLESLPVFHVAVMPRHARSFVQKNKGIPYEFFIRNGPQTVSLDYPTFHSHMMTRSRDE